MKKYLILISLVSSTFISNAQNFSFEDVDDRLSALPGTEEATQLAAHVDLVNMTGTEFDMKCRREIVNMPNGATESFCWGGLCYAEGTAISIFNDTLEPDGTIVSEGDDGFSGYYSYNGNTGEAEITYIFYEESFSPNEIRLTALFCVDEASVCETYLGTNEIIQEPSLGDASPNPANGNVLLSYDFSTLGGAKYIVVRDAIGNEVEKINLNNRLGLVAFNVADYSSGMYFYSLVSDGTSIQTKRLMVNH